MSNPAPVPATPRRTERQRLASELKEQEQTVIEAIDEMIGSRSDSEFGLESFEKALMLMRSVRLALEDEAKKLEAAETAVVS